MHVLKKLGTKLVDTGSFYYYANLQTEANTVRQ